MPINLEDLTTEQQATFRSEIGVNVANTLALLDTSGSITVNPSGTNLERGAALVAAYTAAKLLTPNGAALSANNRATVILPPGRYKLVATFVQDSDFIDIVAQFPQRGGGRLATDNDDLYNAITPLSQYRPPPTEVYSDELTTPFTVWEKTCVDSRMAGFAIAYTGAMDGDGFDAQPAAWHAFHVDISAAEAGSLSVYDRMYFWHRAAYLLGGHAVHFTKHVQGTWIDCVANSYSWRIGPSGTFSAYMRDCEFGAYSVGGDETGITFGACRLERCRGIGIRDGVNKSGEACFGGCTTWGAPSTVDSWFIECEAGDNSFSQGKTAAGNYIRCRGGNDCFAGTTDIGHTYNGTFSGYAEDCYALRGSFGGTTQAGYGKLSGTLVRCTITGDTVSRRCEGATIRDSRITCTTTGIHSLTLLDSNSVISNSDLIVLQGGTGVPIYAASALNVAAYGCRMNNATNDADGLGSNVTNLVTSAGNVVSNSIT